MVTVKAVQPFGSTNSQDPASVFFNTISPRPEAGTGAHADGGAEHVITVQCQALACGATLQVKVPLEYFSGNGDVLVKCGQCKKLLKVQLPQSSFSGPKSTVAPPLVPTPTVGPPAALQDAVPAAATMAMAQPTAAVAQVPTNIPVPQNLPAPEAPSGSTAFNNDHPTNRSTELQQQEKCGPGGSKAQTVGESPTASWPRQQAQLAQLNKLAAGARSTAPATLMHSNSPIVNQHPRQLHAGAAAQAYSCQLAQQQPQYQQISRPPMGPPAARPPNIRPSAPVGLLAGHSAMQLRPSSHAGGSNASLGMSLGQQQTASGLGAAAAAGPQQASSAGWDDPAVGFARRHQVQPAPGGVGSDFSEQLPAAAAMLPPHPASCGSSGGCEGFIAAQPIAGASHRAPVALRSAGLKQLTYQEVLEQATRATHTPARSPIRNPYRALVEQEQLQQEQLQQQYWRQCLQLQQFERNRAAMLSRPDHNRPGPGRGTNDHMPYVDQYARDALVDAGIKRRSECKAAASTQHELDILEQQQGKRVRRLEESAHYVSPSDLAVRQLGHKGAIRWSGDNPGNWNSKKAAALTDIEYMARETAAAQKYDMPPSAAAAAALGGAPHAAQQYGTSRPGSAGHTLHGVASIQRCEVAGSGATGIAGEGRDILPDPGVMPPPRHITGPSVGLHKLGSDAVNNAFITATGTSTPTAAAAASSCFSSGVAVSAAPGPSPHSSTCMAIVNSSRPWSLNESWRAVVSIQQGQPQHPVSDPVATSLGPAPHELSTCSIETAEEAHGDTLKTMGSGGNYYTDMLRDAITPPPEDQQPAVPGSAATANPSAAARASPTPPAGPPATAVLFQAHNVEARSPAGTPLSAATAAGEAPAASDRPTGHNSNNAAEPTPQAASVTTTYEGGAVSEEGRQVGAARPPANNSCDQSVQSSGDIRSRPQPQSPHVHQQQGVARPAGSGGADNHTAEDLGSPAAGGDRAASRIQFTSMAAAGPTSVAWGSSIDTTAKASNLGLAHVNTSSGPGFDTRSSTQPSETSAALLRRHNSAPVTTGVALLPRPNNTTSAAVIITSGPLAAGAARQA